MNNHGDFKGTLEHLWRNNKPLVYALIVIGLVGVYILYKRSQQGGVIPSNANTTGPTVSGTPSNISNVYNTVTKTVTGKTVFIPAPKGGGTSVTSTPRIATIRPQHQTGPDAPYDKTHTGVPVQLDPTGYHPTGKFLSYGSTIPLVGPIVTGGLNRQGGSNQWYPIVGGYLSAWDIAGIK